MDVTSKHGSVRFVTEHASETDFFGSHAPVANAIATTVHETDVKTVGLLGPWGSGKSTVIKLLAQELAVFKNLTYRIFIYDAWLHQSDPHRRSFIEQLVAFAEAEELCREGQWKDELDLLNRRVETVDVDTTPTFTTAGRFLFVSLLLLPLGFAFASRPWYEASKLATASGLERFLFPAGLALIGLPLLVAASLYLSWRPTWKIFSKPFWMVSNWTQHEEAHKDESILAIVSNKHIHKNRSKLTKSLEPSAIEFQRVFRKILSDISATDRRLVIVVDNLDRLSGKEALDMWATIRSFFLGAMPAEEQLSAHAQPAVVLPVDESAVRKAGNIDGGDGGDALANSFMDKTFDAVFHVTPPVLSNWGAYLDQQLRYCFGSVLESDWVFETKRIYRHKADSGRTVTPRDINKTVNAIVSLWLQWRSTVPFVSIAYYAIFRKSIEQNFGEALNRSHVDISERDPNWQTSIAALHFGVSPDKAVQVLLDNPLRSSLLNGDTEQFSQHMSRPGFPDAFQRALEDNAFLDPSVIIEAAIILDECDPPSSDWLEFAWKRLRTRYAFGDLWSEFGTKSPATLVRLLDHCSANDLSAFLLQIRDRILLWAPALFGQPRFNETAALILRAVADKATNSGIELPKIALQANGAGQLDIAARLIDDRLALKLIKPATSAVLVSSLVERFRIADEAEPLERKARYVLDECKPEDCDALALVAQSFIQERATDNPNNAAAIFVLGHLFSTLATAQQAVEALATNGQLQGLLNQYAQIPDIEGASRVAALLILADQIMSPPSGIGWTQFVSEHPSFPGKVDSLIRLWREPSFYGLLINQIERDASLMPLIGPIATASVTRQRIGTLPVKRVIDDPSRFMSPISEDQHTSFVVQISEYTNFWERLADAKFADGAVSIITTLIGSEAVPTALRRKTRSWLLQRLKEVPKEIWSTAVTTNGQPLGLALEYNQLVGQTAIGIHLFDALDTLMPELIASETRPYAVKWFEAAQLLGKNHHKTLLRNMRDHLLGITPPPGLFQLLATGGSDLIETGEFGEKADETVRHIVLQGMTPDGLPWLLEHQAIVQLWLQNATAETRKVTLQRAAQRLGELDGEDKARLELLLNGWPA